MKIEIREDGSLILLSESEFELSFLQNFFSPRQGTKEYFQKAGVSVADVYGVVIKK